MDMQFISNNDQSQFIKIMDNLDQQAANSVETGSKGG